MLKTIKEEGLEAPRTETESQLSGLEQIVPKEKIDQSMTFRIAEERDENGEVIDADVFWTKLEHEGQVAEGKLWVPKSGKTDKLVIFEPGMPGDSTSWMEEKHVKGLTEEGYTVMILRHLGTKTDVDNANNYIHCPERVERAETNGVKSLGEDRKYNIEEASHEVGTATNVLGGQFEQISLVGHSSGVVNTVHDFPNIDPEVQKKIDRFIGLSGYINDEHFREFFEREAGEKSGIGGLKKYYEYCKDVIRIGEAEDNVQAVKRMISEIEARGKNALPDQVMVTQLHSPQDEFFMSEGPKHFRDKVLGRGAVIRDDTQASSGAAEYDDPAHGLREMKTAQLLRMLQSSHRPGITVNERLTRTEEMREKIKDL